MLPYSGDDGAVERAVLEPVDLELIWLAAVLAFPAIPLQDFQLQLAVTLGVEAKPRSFSKFATHADRPDVALELLLVSMRGRGV